MSGGKGGSQTSAVTIPEWLKGPSQRAIQRGEDISQVGFVPYSGPDVAAFAPAQLQSFQNVGAAADAFGLGGGDLTSGLPTPETFAGGVQGFSAAPLYEQALAELQQSRPGQFDAINSFFLDPVTGALPQSAIPAPSIAAPQAQSGGGGGGTSFHRPQDRAQGQGFTSFADLFDGGGAGSSGDRFEGGFLSGAANRLTNPFGSRR
jgi:hypothetical protein